MEKRNEIYAPWYLQRRSLFRVQSTSTRGKCHSAIKSDPTKQVNNQLISFWVILESDQ